MLHWKAICWLSPDIFCLYGGLQFVVQRCGEGLGQNVSDVFPETDDIFVADIDSFGLNPVVSWYNLLKKLAMLGTNFGPCLVIL